MRVILGNDHAGVGLKDHVRSVLQALATEVVDLGSDDAGEPVDFPDITRSVCERVKEDESTRGVLLCGTGVGAAIAANKVAGIRAAMCQDTFCARQGVEHDDVNVLCLGAWIVGPVIAEQILESFLAATFSSDPDFRRRVSKLNEMDRTRTRWDG